MPIHRTSSGWQWGQHGKIYKSRAGAAKQAAAAYAHGYQGDDSETKVASVALRTANGSLLFARRSPTASDHQGEWAFPAGHVEPGEDPMAAARRELEEETGINLNETQLSLVDRREGVALFAAELPTETAVKLNTEHDEYRWAQPELAPKPLHPWVATAVEMTDEVSEEFGNKVEQLIHRGMSQKQAVRVVYEEQRHGGIHHDTSYFAKENLGQSRKVTPEGFLICEAVPIARTGEQLYSHNELPELEPNGAGYIVVVRPPEEVFAPETLASFEGKDVVMNHPSDGVDTTSWKELSVGHAQNLRRGEGIEDDLLLADLVIKVPEAIEYINKRLPEVSAGYHADYEQEEAGRAVQRNIRGNHIAALVGLSGRAGARVSFKDAAIPPSPSTEELAMTTKTVPETFWSKLRSILGSAGVKTADADTQVAGLQKIITDAHDDDDDDHKALDARIADAIAKAFKSRDAVEEERKKKESDDAARRAHDAEEEARKRREAAGGEAAETESTGDTVLEAEQVGHVINLGKTWTGGMTGDASATEPVLQAVISRAELLSPGITKPTADALKGNKGTVLANFMRTTLEKYITTDAANAMHLAPMLLGKRIADLKGSQLLGTFNFAANLARSRNNQLAAQAAARRITGDFSASKLSITQLNEQARVFWENGGKLPPGWKPTVQ